MKNFIKLLTIFVLIFFSTSKSYSAEKVKLLETDYVDSVDVQELVDESLVHMLDVLDPHTTYVPIKNRAISDAALEAGFEGIGVFFSVLGSRPP